MFMTVAIRKLCLLCSFGRRYMFIAASCSYTHTLPYNHHRCSSVPSECDAALQFLCNGLQSTSFAMGCNYKVHCSFMQLLTLPYKHRPYLNVTVMLQCSSVQLCGPTLPYNHHPCPSVTVMLPCSSCAMGWRRTLQ